MHFGLLIVTLGLWATLVSSCPDMRELTDYAPWGPLANIGRLSKKSPFWPKGIVKWCFESTGKYAVNDEFKARFEKGLKLWTDYNDLLVKFQKEDACPATNKESAHFLRVRLDPKAKLCMTTNGYKGDQMIHDFGDPPQYLTMAGKYDFGKDTPDLKNWAGVVAHEISHVLSLPHQSQNPHALDQMELNSEALSDCPSFPPKKKKAFTDACQDLVNTKSYSTSTEFKTEFSREPERYAPFSAPLRQLTDFFPKAVNWGSITFYNRPVDAKKKKAVFNKKDGGTVPFSSWKSGPNQADIDQVNNIYKSPLGTVGAPPGYDCEV